MAVKNAGPVTQAVSKLELRIVVPASQDPTSSMNSGSKSNLFEQRCVQETGTH